MRGEYPASPGTITCTLYKYIHSTPNSSPPYCIISWLGSLGSCRKDSDHSSEYDIVQPYKYIIQYTAECLASGLTMLQISRPFVRQTRKLRVATWQTGSLSSGIQLFSLFRGLAKPFIMKRHRWVGGWHDTWKRPAFLKGIFLICLIYLICVMIRRDLWAPGQLVNSTMALDGPDQSRVTVQSPKSKVQLPKRYPFLAQCQK